MRTVLFMLLAFWNVTGALAGDTEKLAFIGYSKDANYFAFETYGVGDGSGLGYSDIYIIDVKTNSWVQGSPIRMRGETENLTQAVAREEAHKMAAPLILKYGISLPVMVLAQNPITEIIADRNRIEFDSFHKSFGNSSVLPGETADNRFVISLTDFPLGANADCLSETGARHGFGLLVKQTLSGKVLEVHKDTSVPASRGCPYKYEIEAIVATDDDQTIGMIAMIAYYTQGFEGPDRKVIAVPFTLP
jgi:predicted secreted protein